MDRSKRQRILARNKLAGRRAENRNERASLEYMTNLKYEKEKVMPGTRLDFALTDKKGEKISAIQEVKSGAIRGRKAFNQMRTQHTIARQLGAKYVLLYPGGYEGFRTAKNVSHKIKKMMYRAIGSGMARVKDSNKLIGFNPLINITGGKVKSIVRPDPKSQTPQQPSAPPARHAGRVALSTSPKRAHAAAPRHKAAKSSAPASSKPDSTGHRAKPRSTSVPSRAPRHARHKPAAQGSTKPASASKPVVPTKPDTRAASRGSSSQRPSTPASPKPAPRPPAPAKQPIAPKVAPPTVTAATKAAAPASAPPPTASSIAFSSSSKMR